jgi:hypothetical protein
MVWLIVRTLITLVGITLGLWVAFHEGRRRRARLLGTVIVLVAVAQGAKDLLDVGDMVFDYFRRKSDAIIHDAQIAPDRRALETFNKSGQPLWRRVVAGQIQKVLLNDIDGDGQLDVIVGVGGDDKDSGRILAYRQDGTALWSFDVNATYPYRGGSSNRLTISDLLVDEPPGSRVKRLVGLSRDVHWYPSRLVVLDAAGHLRSEFWHPGQLHHLRVATTRSGDRRLIVAGINNDLRQTALGNGSDKNFYVIFAFDPRTIAGEGPPFLGRIGQGTYVWYLVLLPQGDGVSDIEVLDRNRDGQPEIGVWLDCGYVFYFNLDAASTGVGRGDNARCDERVRFLNLPRP